VAPDFLWDDARGGLHVSEAVGIAVVGTGDWGANLVRNFANVKGGRLALLCDSDAQRLTRAAAQAPEARRATDAREVASAADVQAVVISSSAISHYPLAKAMLEAGKDVYVEKPLALSVEHAEGMVRLARERGRILMVGHLLIHHPAVQYLKRLVQEGALGDIHYLYTQRVNLGRVRRDENALWSFAPHDISVILHLLGDQPLDVTARGSAFLQEKVEDVAFLNLRFPKGRMANVHVSWLDPHKVRRCTVVGSKKMAVFDDMEASEKLRIYDKGVDRAGEVVPYGDVLSVRSGDIVIPKISLQEPLKLECQHFVDCVRDRKTPITDGESGLRVVRVLAAAQASLERDGAPVAITTARQEVA
jgi:predicted dehydrogenase